MFAARKTKQGEGINTICYLAPNSPPCGGKRTLRLGCLYRYWQTEEFPNKTKLYGLPLDIGPAPALLGSVSSTNASQGASNDGGAWNITL